MSRSAIPNSLCLFVCLCAFLCGSRLFGTVLVSNGRITKGTSVSVPTNGLGLFRCTIENPDAESHRVRLRILPPGENVNNPEFSVPGKSKMEVRVPVYVNRWDKYKFDVFQDGKQLPGSVLNECTLQLPDSSSEQVGFVNNTGTTIGGLNKNTQLPRRFVPIMYRAEDLPETWREFDRLRMLVVCTPNFQVCSSAQFAAVREYVAHGGTLVFVNPEGLLAAGSTPLADLLPVIPLRIRKVSRLDGVESLVGGNSFRGLGGREIEFVDCVETSADSGVTFASYEGFPLMRECRYGLGTVRILSFFPSRSTFPNSGDFADRLIARALATPYCQPSFQGFRRPLDHLTGFTIPHVSLVESLLGVYFVLLAVLFVGLKRAGRGGWCWAGAVALALACTAGILAYANRTLGDRGALMAELRVENSCVGGSGQCYVSMYVPKSGKSSIRGVNRRSLLGCIPRNPTILKDRFEMQQSSMSPLDVRVCPDGVMEIRGMNFGARTSRQFLEFRNSDHQVESHSVSSPRLLLNREGLTLMNWQLPAGLHGAEAFMLFPNGSRAVNVDSDGVCRMGEESSMLKDPFLMDLRSALERSCGKLHPSLVAVTDFEPEARGSFSETTLQGKRLVLFPAEVIPSESGVKVPNELLVLSPDHAVSSLMLNGNRLNTDYTFMGDFYARLHVTLPTSMGQLQVKGIRVRLKTSNTERIRPEVMFLPDGDEKHPFKGTWDEDAGAFVFSGDGIDGVFDRESLHGTLMIKGRILPRGEKEQDFSANNWSVLDLGIAVEGTLPSSVVRKSL